MLKGKILTLNETLNNTELETKASRETIMRLVSEVGKEQRDFERRTHEMDAFRSVRVGLSSLLCVCPIGVYCKLFLFPSYVCTQSL